MAYNTGKLVNLGQLKSALQTVKTNITAAKSVRTIITVASTGWSTYDSTSHKYANLFTVSNYTHYDIHLTEDTSKAVGIMCANADIHAKIQSGVVNLYCYGAVPTEPFTVEVIATPLTTNVVGLNYDFGDDYLVYKSVTDALDARITTLEADTPKMIIFSRNIALSTSRWSASGIPAYPYKAVLNIPNVTEDYLPWVQFEDTDVDLYEFSPNATSGAGTVTVYCKTKPTTPVIVPQVSCYKGFLVQGS